LRLSELFLPGYGWPSPFERYQGRGKLVPEQKVPWDFNYFSQQALSGETRRHISALGPDLPPGQAPTSQHFQQLPG
jgi:hypothetical protein